MKVNKTTHPRLFTMFIEIGYDNGAFFRGRPEPDEYIIPNSWKERFIAAEYELIPLTKLQIEVLCTGEETEQKELITLYQLNATDQILHEFFDNWMNQGDPGYEVNEEG